MFSRLTQEHARTFRGIPGGRSATRSTSVRRYAQCRKGTASRGCKPYHLGPLVDGELMAQGNDFELERHPGTEGGLEPANEEEQKGAHGGLAKGACPPILPADLNLRSYSGYQGVRIFGTHNVVNKGL